MAGGSTSEEMDAFDDVTPAKPVSIYDLDEDLPTRMQTSDEIAEYQAKTREKREAAFRSFAPPTERTSSPAPERTSSPSASDPGSAPSVRPVPRESGPVRIDRTPGTPVDRLRVPPPRDSSDGPDLEEMLNDVAATLERLPPAPRVPKIEQPRGSLETIGSPHDPPAPRPAPRRSRWRTPIVALIVVVTSVAAVLATLTFFR